MLVTALVLCTGWNLRVGGDNDIYNDMQHPVCLLNIHTTTTPVDMAGGGLGRTRIEGSSVAELGGKISGLLSGPVWVFGRGEHGRVVGT